MAKKTRTRTVYRDPRGRFTSKAKYEAGKKRGNARKWKRENYKVKPGKRRGVKAPPRLPGPVGEITSIDQYREFYDAAGPEDFEPVPDLTGGLDYGEEE